MHYHLHHNPDARRSRGYRPGDKLTDGYHGTLDAATDITDAVDTIFWCHNSPDRPDDATAPCLTIGDVIVIDGHAVTVEPTRFAAVTIDPDDFLHHPYQDRP